MNLTKPQKKRLLQALFLAIDYQESLIDSYKTYIPGSNGGRYAIMKENRKWTNQWERDIKAFRKLISIVRGN